AEGGPPAHPGAARDAAVAGASPEPYGRRRSRRYRDSGGARVLSPAYAGGRAGGLRGAANPRPDGTRARDRPPLGGLSMRLGIISDTHGLLRPEVFDVFREVDHILHAGDIGPAELLVELEAIAPVTAVYGNTDDWDIRRRLPDVARIELEGFRIVVTHGDSFGRTPPEALNRAFPEAEILVFGHTHRPLLTLVDEVVTVMNPGGAGAPRFGIPPSVGIMELEPGIPPRARLVPLLDLTD